jgi:hypothetical protein
VQNKRTGVKQHRDVAQEGEMNRLFFLVQQVLLVGSFLLASSASSFGQTRPGDELHYVAGPVLAGPPLHTKELPEGQRSIQAVVRRVGRGLSQESLQTLSHVLDQVVHTRRQVNVISSRGSRIETRDFTRYVAEIGSHLAGHMRHHQDTEPVLQWMGRSVGRMYELGYRNIAIETSSVSGDLRDYALMGQAPARFQNLAWRKERWRVPKSVRDQTPKPPPVTKPPPPIKKVRTCSTRPVQRRTRTHKKTQRFLR